MTGQRRPWGLLNLDGNDLPDPTSTLTPSHQRRKRHSMHSDNTSQFLFGGSIPSAKFPAIGATVTGTIAMTPEVQQQRDFRTGEPKSWKDGGPMQQLKVVLNTNERDPEIADDEGQRAVYVKGRLKDAVREAVQNAQAKGLAVGGKLTVTYVGDGEIAERGMNPPKLYTAVYAPPATPGMEGLVPSAPAPTAYTQAAPAPAPQQAPPAAPAAAQAPAGGGLSPEQQAAFAQLTPEQRAALFNGGAPF